MDPRKSIKYFISDYRAIMEDARDEQGRHEKALEQINATYKSGMDGGRIDAEYSRHDSAMTRLNASTLQLARKVEEDVNDWIADTVGAPMGADLAATLQLLAERKHVTQAELDALAKSCMGNYHAMRAIVEIAASKGLEHPIRGGYGLSGKGAPAIDSVTDALGGFMRACGDGLEKSTGDNSAAPIVIESYGAPGRHYLQTVALADKLAMAEALLDEVDRFMHFYVEGKPGEAAAAYMDLGYASPNDGQTVGLGHTVGLF